MIWNVMMGAAAAAAVAGWGIVQDPGFDYEVATPEAGGQFKLATYQREATVSVRFHDAKVGEVLGWLEKQGVSFVVADAKLKDRTITMSVTNQPVNTVADAIASALGGRWQRQGSILIYRDGGDGFFQFTAPKGDTLMSPYTKGGQTWEVNPKALQHGDTLLMPKSGDTFKWEFTPKAGDGLSKEPQPPIGLYHLDPKVLTIPNGKGDIYWDQVKPLSPDKNLKEWTDQVKVFSKDSTEGFFVMTGQADMHKLAKSLTDKQRELMKGQGYLKLNDLTSEQRDMLGIRITGKFLDLGNMPEDVGIQFVPDSGDKVIIRDK